MGKNKSLISGSPGNETIHYRYNNKMECIFLKDIAYIESDGVYSIIYKSDGDRLDKKMICKCLGALEKQLKDYDFIRCHIYYLVNTRRVENFSSGGKELTVCSKKLEVSRRKTKKVFPVLLDKGIKDINENTVNKNF